MTDNKRLRAALVKFTHIADEARIHWDRDEDAKVGKILLALSGNLPGYRADIDAIHAAISDAASDENGDLPA